MYDRRVLGGVNERQKKQRRANQQPSLPVLNTMKPFQGLTHYTSYVSAYIMLHTLLSVG